jgi:WD40 repeat protein
MGILEGHTDSVSSICISPDGKKIISGGNDKTVRVWNLDKLK